MGSNSSSDDEAPSGPSRTSDGKDDSTIEMIRRYMADKLGFLDKEEKSHEKVLKVYVYIQSYVSYYGEYCVIITKFLFRFSKNLPWMVLSST